MVKRTNCCRAKRALRQKEEIAVELREPYGKKKKLL